MVNNKAKGPMILNPKAYNIYYGASPDNALKQQVVDNFAKNIGNTSYYKILRTYQDAKGRTPAPLQFVGSTINPVKPTALTVDPIDGASTFIADIMLKYVRAGTLPLNDLNNTIFTILMGPGWTYPASRSYCGFHWQYNFTRSIKMYISFVVHGDADGCNVFGITSYDDINTDGKSPNNNPGIDSVASVYIHELFESISDPVGTTWLTNDDYQYVGYADDYTNPFHIGQGGEENGDICAYLFGTAPAYAVSGATLQNANIKLAVPPGATFSPYYLIQQMPVIAPPNSQCAMSQYMPTIQQYRYSGLTVFNAINDTASQYIMEFVYRYTDGTDMLDHAFVRCATAVCPLRHLASSHAHQKTSSSSTPTAVNGSVTAPTRSSAGRWATWKSPTCVCCRA
jgi:hypothetical protein